MEEDDQLPQDPDGQEDQESEQSQSPDLGQLKDAKDTFGRLTGGPKPPLSQAAGVGAESTAAGATGATGAAATTTAATATGATGAAAAGTATTGAAGAASAPVWVPIAIIVGIILLILFIVIAVMMGGSEDEENQLSSVALVKSGPESVPNNTNISYSIAVLYLGIADDVIIRDPIPDNTEFVSASPNARTLDSSGTETTDPALVKTVTWSLKEIQNSSGQSAFLPQTLSLTVRPLSSDIYVVNQALAEVLGGSGDPNITPVPSGIIPPNEDDCGGYYTSSINKNPLKKNFGDPNCVMLANNKPEDKDKLYALFQTLDLTYADYWFFTITPCESSYNPNAFYAGAPASGGAWGLLQMGAGFAGGPPKGPTPGLPLSFGGKNHQTDRGDLNWEIQASNAINYNAVLKSMPDTATEDPDDTLEWQYWQCANGTHP